MDIAKLLGYIKLPQMFFEAVYEKIAEKAKAGGKSFKEYMSDDKNIHHLSLIAYDVLPFAFKVGMRHEKFYEYFAKHFKDWRKKLFNIDSAREVATQKVVAKKTATKVAAKSAVKTVAKKAVKTAAKKTVVPAKKPVKTPTKPSLVKAPAKKAVAKKTAAKKVAKKSVE